MQTTEINWLTFHPTIEGEQR